MNLPNKLSLLRMILVPVFMIVLALPASVLPLWLSAVLGAIIFIVASITDCLDGKIARKYHLITDFGKLIDPLADKFMVIGALIMILYRAVDYRALFVVALTVVVFRELAVTAMRLITATKSGVAVPANMLGKIKTVSQMVLVLFLMLVGRLAPVVLPDVVLMETAVEVISFMLQTAIKVIGWALTIWVVVITVWSGVDYFIRNFDVIRNAK